MRAFTFLTIKCPGCGETWQPRVVAPIRCPRCFRVLPKKAKA